MEHTPFLAYTLVGHRAKNSPITVAYILDTIAIWLVVGLLVFMDIVVVVGNGLERLVARFSRHNYR